MLDSNEYPGTPISLGDSNEFLVAIVQWNVHLFTSQPRKSSASPCAMSPSLPLNPGKPQLPPMQCPLFTSQLGKSSATPNAMSPSLPLNPGRALLPPMKYPHLYLSAQEELCFLPMQWPPLYLSAKEELCFPRMQCPHL